MASTLPQNQARFTLGELVHATGATLSGPSSPDRTIEGVSTDSRSALTGKLFVALRGDRFDGHAYARAAAEAGAAAVLVDSDVGTLSVPTLRVPSTLAGLR